MLIFDSSLQSTFIHRDSGLCKCIIANSNRILRFRLGMQGRSMAKKPSTQSNFFQTTSQSSFMQILPVKYPYQKDGLNLRQISLSFFSCGFSFFPFRIFDISRYRIHRTVNHILGTLKFCCYFTHWRILFSIISHNELFFISGVQLRFCWFYFEI